MYSIETTDRQVRDWLTKQEQEARLKEQKAPQPVPDQQEELLRRQQEYFEAPY